MIGRQLGNYRITEPLGGGGVGEVWKAEDLVLGRPVAIKALRPELAARETVVARFRSEAQTLARLNHPHIATLYALLEEPPSLYMVMEYVEGATLAGLLRSSGRLAPALAGDLLLQALDGIGHAHAAGVVHRDIKGSNLMVDASGRVKVMDFGIARAVGSERMTRLGNLVGTPEFMAPEQIRGGEATVRSDVYALGVLLYEMLAGEVPFRGESEFDVLRAHVEAPPTPLRERVPEVPEAVERAVLRALEKAPERRFETTAAFAAALEAAGMRARSTPVPELAGRGALRTDELEAPTDLAAPRPAPEGGDPGAMPPARRTDDAASENAATADAPPPATRVDGAEEGELSEQEEGPPAARPDAGENAPTARPPAAATAEDEAPPPTRVIDLGAGRPEPTRPDRPAPRVPGRRVRWAALAATAALALGAGFLTAPPAADDGPALREPGAVAAARAGDSQANGPPLVGPPRAGKAEGAPLGGMGGGSAAEPSRTERDPAAPKRREPERRAERRKPERTGAGETERTRRGWVIRWE